MHIWSKTIKKQKFYEKVQDTHETNIFICFLGKTKIERRLHCIKIIFMKVVFCVFFSPLFGKEVPKQIKETDLAECVINEWYSFFWTGQWKVH